MAKNTFIPLENEHVLLEAKVGKKIFHVFLLFELCCLIIGAVLVATGTMAVLNSIDKSWLILVFAGILFVVIFLLVGVYLSSQNRRYVLTDKRIVILKGGKIKHTNRSLSLKSIQGVEKIDNFIYNLYGLATIDFYALAVASNTTKIKFLSFSSTNFKFQWVDKEDAIVAYGFMQNYLVNGAFPSKEDASSSPQNDELTSANSNSEGTQA